MQEGLQHLAGDAAGVAVDGVGEQVGPQRPHAQQVVHVHHHRVLHQILEHLQVAGLAVGEVGAHGLGAGAVGVHGEAVVRIAGEGVRHELAERPGKEPRILPVYRGVDVLLLG